MKRVPPFYGNVYYNIARNGQCLFVGFPNYIPNKHNAGDGEAWTRQRARKEKWTLVCALKIFTFCLAWCFIEAFLKSNIYVNIHMCSYYVLMMWRACVMCPECSLWWRYQRLFFVFLSSLVQFFILFFLSIFAPFLGFIIFFFSVILLRLWQCFKEKICWDTLWNNPTLSYRSKSRFIESSVPRWTCISNVRVASKGNARAI